VQENFGGAKYCPNFPKLAQKVVQILPTDFWCGLQKNGLHLSFCKRWVPFLKSNNFGAIFPQIFRDFVRIFRDFTRFSGILPKFSANQNFWRCACNPPSRSLCRLHKRHFGCIDDCRSLNRSRTLKLKKKFRIRIQKLWNRSGVGLSN